MKANYIPAAVMLTAGFIDCILGIVQGLPLLDFTIELLIVLIIFYVIGTVIKWFYMANFKEEEAAEDEVSDEEVTEEESADQETTEEETSEQQTEAGEN